MGTALAYALKFATALPDLLTAGQGITAVLGLAKDHAAKLKEFTDQNRGPTPEEWAAQDTRIAALRAELHAPE